MSNLTRKQEEVLKYVWAVILQYGTKKHQEQIDEKENLSEVSEKQKIGEENGDTYKNGMHIKEGNENVLHSNNEGFHDNERYTWTKAFGEMLKNEGKELLTTFWEMVKMDDPDRLVQRFLRARKWDKDKALVMLIETLKWRRKFNVEMILRNGDGDENEVDADMFLKQMKLGKSFIRGVDRENRPVCYIRTHLHRPTDQPDVTVQRYIVWIMENARFMLSSHVETATILFDLTNFSLKNVDYAPIKFLIKCFEAHYPECMGICIVHKAPWVFQGIWKIIKGWLDPIVVKKIHFTNSRKELETYIDAFQLIKELGGQNNWEYVYIGPIEGENDKMKDTNTRDKLMQKRRALIEDFEALTIKWIEEKNEVVSDRLWTERNCVVDSLSRNYWELDPYIRRRSFYDRIGAILPK
ncbi:hypothetical protein PORY_001602 [Pneumocystis oryctolagi]|uniref:Uncharacterized protein n=1 Tax=Pneumocystis oryctolagi TaxID=42067 RepID=A0ACB7CCY0_9ASCO|nr:hypothetical protein PORY_001602 [Pneumocystis oryctolagi]